MENATKTFWLTRWIKNLTITRRLYAVLLLSAITPIILGSILVIRKYDEVKGIKTERAGLNLINAMRRLRFDLRVHQAAVWNATFSLNDSNSSVSTAATRVDELIKQGNDILQHEGAESQLIAKYHELAELWKETKAVTSLSRNQDLLTATKHEKLAREVFSVVTLSLENAGILLDTDAASLYTILGLTIEYPAQIRALQNSRFIGLEALLKRNITDARASDFERSLGELRLANERVKQYFNRIYFFEPKAKEVLEKSLIDLQEATNSAISLLDKYILADRSLSFDVRQYHLRFSEIVSKYNNFGDTAEKFLIDRMEARVVQGNASNTTMILILLLSLVLLFALMFIVIRSISRPLMAAVERVRDIAEGDGDLTKRLDDSSRDELGTLSRWINAFIGNLDGIIGNLYRTSNKLTLSSGVLSETSQSLSSGSEQVSQQSSVIAASATQMNQNLQVLTSAVEEMSISVGEVAKKATDSAKVAAEANATAADTTAIVKELGQNANDIGKVIESIASIAAQTNLLALNAAIEAASAGEAGKGFAVVASEVKELARQTAESSSEIKTKIAAIQDSTERTIEAIGKISDVIGRVNEISTAIASAVEEQSITSREIASNITQVSTASGEVTKNISGISTVAQAQASDAGKTSSLSSDLRTAADGVSTIVNKFKISDALNPQTT